MPLHLDLAKLARRDFLWPATRAALVSLLAILRAKADSPTTNRPYVLFRDLWLRPDLAPRDRSLVTAAALIASGQIAQIPYHINRAMNNGLTEAQAGEGMTHLAFDVGWPNVFTALPVAKDVFEKRAH